MAEHFTRQEIEEIRMQLAQQGKKDTDFIETDKFTGDDYFVIVQDGKNKKISARTFRSDYNEIAEQDHQTAMADHQTAESDSAQAGRDHQTAVNDHAIAVADHALVAPDHAQAEADSLRARQDHNVAVADHAIAVEDHNQAVSDSIESAEATTNAITAAALANAKAELVQDKLDTADQDHVQAESDHRTATTDHAIADGDHTAALIDHENYVLDHAQSADDSRVAGINAMQAQNDHTRAESDHNTALNDHTTAQADHGIAVADHNVATDAASLANEKASEAENAAGRANEAAAAAEHQVDVKRGYGIQSVTQPVVATTNGGVNTIRVTTEDGKTFDIQVRNGKSSAGFFQTSQALNTAIPSPNAGDYAFVSKAEDGSFPAYIYVCTTAGTWSATEAEYDGDSVDLTPYATKEQVSQLGQEVDEEIKNIHSLLQTAETPKSVTNVKPSSTGVYITGDSNNYASYYIPVLKGQIVYYSATNSAKKPISCCFSSAVPAIDGTLTDYVLADATSVAWEFVAPYDGYFVVYHYKTYFTNQKFDSVLSINQRTDSTPTNNSKNFVTSGGLFTEFHKSDVIPIEVRVVNIRPEETGFFAEAGSNSVFCWYIPVLEGDVVHYMATDSGSRTLITCFCSQAPAVGVSITDRNQTSVSNVNRYITAPYSGFFVVYHHINYFTNQGFTIRSPYSAFSSGRLELEGGQIGTDGRPVCETTSRLAYMSSFRTPLYIRASKLIYISNILQGETVKIYCYDSNLRYLGVYTDVNNLSPETYYVKIAVSQESEYTGGKTISVYGANNDGVFSQVYNAAGTDTQAISFEVGAKIDMIDDYSSGSATVDMSNERHFDNGVIRLPYNYQYQGEPVKLAIFWHGTGGQDFRSPGMQYPNQMEHLQRNGYLVADCSGMTDKYQLGDDAVASHDCRFNPLAVSCFCALYDYVVRNYNVRKDGCYVFGKSNGGLGATYLGITRPFPIKAVASLAGSLSIVESMRYSSCSNLNYWCARFGMTGYTFSYSDLSYYYANQTPEGNAFIIGGADKYKKWDPFILLTGMDESTLAETMFEYGYTDAQQTNLWAMVNANAKVQSTPMKIWHAVDDNSVPIYISRMYKALVERMNGICFLREIPAGYGGHHAVDNADDAPTVTVKTKYDGVHNIVATYEELVEWFNRW